jgi:hypothetical protein
VPSVTKPDARFARFPGGYCSARLLHPKMCRVDRAARRIDPLEQPREKLLREQRVQAQPLLSERRPLPHGRDVDEAGLPSGFQKRLLRKRTCESAGVGRLVLKHLLGQRPIDHRI